MHYLGERGFELTKNQNTKKSKFKIPGWASLRTSETLDLQARLQSFTFEFPLSFEVGQIFLYFQLRFICSFGSEPVPLGRTSSCSSQISNATNALSFTLFPFCSLFHVFSPFCSFFHASPPFCSLFHAFRPPFCSLFQSKNLKEGQRSLSVQSQSFGPQVKVYHATSPDLIQAQCVLGKKQPKAADLLVIKTVRFSSWRESQFANFLILWFSDNACWQFFWSPNKCALSSCSLLPCL